MFIKFSKILFFVKRYLFLSLKIKKKNFIPLTGFFPILGIACGVFCFITVLSIMSGFVGGIKAHLFKIQPHIEVRKKTTEGMPLSDLKPLIWEAASLDIVSYKLIYEDFVILKSAYGRVALAKLRGVDRQTFLDDRLFYLGTPQALFEQNMVREKKGAIGNMFLGKDLINHLRTHEGDKVWVIPGHGLLEDLENGFGVQEYPFQVKGILNLGQFLYDKKMALISEENAK
jgi:ABC-type lipoprotein release transport system permease subunit